MCKPEKAGITWVFVERVLVIVANSVNMWTSEHTRTHRKDSRSSMAMCKAGTPWFQAACPAIHNVAEDVD